MDTYNLNTLPTYHINIIMDFVFIYGFTKTIQYFEDSSDYQLAQFTLGLYLETYTH